MLKRLAWGQMVCAVLSVLMLICAYLGYHADRQNVFSENTTVPVHKAGIDPLMADSPASQTFKAKERDFSSLDVMISNYNKKVRTGTLTMWVVNDRGVEVGRITVEVSGVKNNAFVSIPFQPAQTDSEGKSFTLYATAEGVDQKGVTIRSGPIAEPDGSMVLTRADGSTDTENALYLRLNYTHTIYGIMAGMTFLLLAMCFAACIPFAGKERNHG